MSKGSNSSGLRRYNERVLITFLRKLGAASKFELSQLAQLTPQAVTRIVDDLAAAGLIREQGRRTGGLGQPATLYCINPQGAYAIGANVGRRDLQLLLMDFGGEVIEKISHEFEVPDADFLLEKIHQGIKALSVRLPAKQRTRLMGIGVAMPWFMGAWSQELNMPPAIAARWNSINFAAEVNARARLPVFFENDCSAAAIAELQFGEGVQINNFIYGFIGTFIGGGLVLDGNLESGVHGNAGDLASMPVPPSRLNSAPPLEGPFETLMNRASIYVLRRHLNKQGFAIKNISELDKYLPAAQPFIDEWISDCAEALTFAFFSATSLLDVEAVILDANLPRPLLQKLVDTIGENINRLTPKGIFTPRILCGKLGVDARAIGGALLPFYANFSPDKTVMLTGGVPKKVAQS